MLEGSRVAVRQTGMESALAGPVTFDDLLVAVGRTRNRDAFIRLFEYFAPRVKSYLMKGGMTPEQADDLAQETMIAVWNNASSYRPGKAGASTWIFTIARNKRVDLLRKKSPILADPDDAVNDDSPLPDDVLSRVDDTKAITQALAALPQEQADLVRKAYFEDKSHNDIARETDLPLGTVKSRIRLAMERLRQSLKGRV